MLLKPQFHKKCKKKCQQIAKKHVFRNHNNEKSKMQKKNRETNRLKKSRINKIMKNKLLKITKISIKFQKLMNTCLKIKKSQENSEK